MKTTLRSRKHSLEIPSLQPRHFLELGDPVCKFHWSHAQISQTGTFAGLSHAVEALLINGIYLWYSHSRSLDCYGKARFQSGPLMSFQGTPKNKTTRGVLDFKNYGHCVPSFSGLLFDARGSCRVSGAGSGGSEQ